MGSGTLILKMTSLVIRAKFHLHSFTPLAMMYQGCSQEGFLKQVQVLM